jgi:hypothetical protein
MLERLKMWWRRYVNFVTPYKFAYRTTMRGIRAMEKMHGMYSEQAMQYAKHFQNPLIGDGFQQAAADYLDEYRSRLLKNERETVVPHACDWYDQAYQDGTEM